MADMKPNDPQIAAEAARNRGQAAVADAVSATLAASQDQAHATARAASRGAEAVQQGVAKLREGAEGAAAGTNDMMRRSAEAGRRGGEAMADSARQGLQFATAGHQQAMQRATAELQQTSRGLAAMAEEAAAGMRHFMAMPGSRGMQDTRQAMQQLVEGVVASNVRMAQELMRRNGPSAVIELQRNFIREYFDALAQGGAVLLRAARQAADESLQPLEAQVQRRQQARHPGTVADVMSTEVKTVGPEDTVQQAAKLMTEADAGALPVRDGDRLVGMLTDRDLALRLAAEGRDPTRTKVREVMSPDIRYVFEDESLDQVAANMAEQRLRRLPVMNRDKRLVGIVSLGDLAGHGEPANTALAGVAPAA